MTEPEKMGFPYMESIISSLHICDEVVLVIGRDEEESDKKINRLKEFLDKDVQDNLNSPSSFPGRKRCSFNINYYSITFL